MYYISLITMSPPREILQSTTLGLAHGEVVLHPESDSADSHSVDSCSADTSRYFTSFNYLGSAKKVGKHSRNHALNYKLTMHNVYYIDPLRT